MKKHLIPLSKRNLALISAQSEAWRRRNLEAKAESRLPVSRPFITISRQFGCGAFPLAEAIAARLNQEEAQDPPWAVYDRALVERIAADHKLSEELVEALGKKNRSELEESVLGLLDSFTPELKVYRSTMATIRALAMFGRAVIVGRGGAIVTRSLPGGLHIRLIAPFEWRVERTREIFKMEGPKAEDYVRKMDEERESFLQKYFHCDAGDLNHYHLILNNALMKPENMLEAVAGAVDCSSG